MNEFDMIVHSLTPEQKEKHKYDIEAIEERLSAPRPGDFWKDPAKKEATKESMRMAWAKKPRGKLIVTRKGVRKGYQTYDEVSKLLLRSPYTVRGAVSKGDGEAEFNVNGEIITVERA